MALPIQYATICEEEYETHVGGGKLPAHFMKGSVRLTIAAVAVRHWPIDTSLLM